DIGVPGGRGWLAYLTGAAVIAALIVWKAGELRLGLLVSGGFAGAMLVAGLVTWGAIAVLTRLRGSGVSWRFGMANLRRRRLASVLQVVALGIGIMALLT